jgi:uncharacterized membrane protein
VLFNAIFLTIFFAAWALCGFLPWFVLSVATRGNAGLGMLPLCVFAGVVAGPAVPLLGLDNGTGIWVSLVVALVVPSALLAIRRFSLGSRENPRPVKMGQSH